MTVSRDSNLSVDRVGGARATYCHLKSLNLLSVETSRIMVRSIRLATTLHRTRCQTASCGLMLTQLAPIGERRVALAI